MDDSTHLETSLTDYFPLQNNSFIKGLRDSINRRFTVVCLLFLSASYLSCLFWFTWNRHKSITLSNVSMLLLFHFLSLISILKEIISQCVQIKYDIILSYFVYLFQELATGELYRTALPPFAISPGSKFILILTLFRWFMKTCQSPHIQTGNRKCHVRREMYSLFFFFPTFVCI